MKFAICSDQFMKYVHPKEEQFRNNSALIGLKFFFFFGLL